MVGQTKWYGTILNDQVTYAVVIGAKSLEKVYRTGRSETIKKKCHVCFSDRYKKSRKSGSYGMISHDQVGYSVEIVKEIRRSRSYETISNNRINNYTVMDEIWSVKVTRSRPEMIRSRLLQ